MSKLPKHYTRFMKDFPEVGRAYRDLGDAVGEAGSLDTKTIELVKLGMSLGAKIEGAVHSHARKALESGAKREEIVHAVLQATTTLGFPTMMMGLSWVEDVFEDSEIPSPLKGDG